MHKFLSLLQVGGLIVSLAIGLNSVPVWAQTPELSVAAFMGPASNTPLVEIARFRDLGIVSSYGIGAAFDQRLFELGQGFAFETEESAMTYLDGSGVFSAAFALTVRWLRTPWCSEASSMQSSFAFGNGFSFANGVPGMERSLPITSSTLYHLYLEVAAGPRAAPWEGIFRIYHRSGAFGMFGGVVGGSDYLTLGVRLKL